MININLTPFPLAKLRADGYEGYIVGGAVRDLLLGLPLQDIDITVFGGDYKNYASILARRFRTSTVIFKDNIRLPLGKLHIDVSAPRGGDIRGDLAMRDFTVNNLALTFAGELLGDPTDLFAKRVVPVYPRALLDDPIRILRAFRQAAHFGFELTDRFFALLPEACAHLQKPAKERVCYELRLLSAARPYEKLYRYMGDYGVLEAVFGFRPNICNPVSVLKSAYGKSDDLFPLFLAAIYSDSGRDIKQELRALTVSNAHQNAAGAVTRLSEQVFNGDVHSAKAALWEAENIGLKGAVLIFGKVHFGELAEEKANFIQDNRKGGVISGEDILALSEAAPGAWVKTVLERTKIALSFGEIAGRSAALDYARKICRELT